MEVKLWSDVTVLLQSAKASAKTITALSKANPAVASCTGHSYTAGDPILIRCVGINGFDYLLVRMAAGVDADHFVLEGVDSTNFPGTFVSATAEKLTMGTSAATITDVNVSGGDSEDVPVRTIHNSQDKSLPGNSAPVVFSFGNYWDPTDPALLACKTYGKAKTRVGFEFVYADGSRVMGVGVPSASLAPGGSAGAAVTTPSKINLVGDLTAYAS